MGIGAYDLRLLIKLKERGLIPNSCSVAEVGAQQLADSFLQSLSDLEIVRAMFGAKKPCPLPQSEADGVQNGTIKHLEASAPFAREFWTWLELGYTAIDIDDSPGSIPLDLNYDDVPIDIRGRFQLVTNYGTTEHI